MGHSRRRYCHVRALVGYPQHRTLPRPTESGLSLSCARPANNWHNCRSSCVRPSTDPATRDTRSYTHRVGITTAMNLHGMCRRDAGPGFCRIAVWRRTAQGRRSADRRPNEGKIKGARCAAVGWLRNADGSSTSHEVRNSATACRFGQPIEPAPIPAPRGRCHALTPKLAWLPLRTAVQVLA